MYLFMIPSSTFVIISWRMIIIELLYILLINSLFFKNGIKIMLMITIVFGLFDKV